MEPHKLIERRRYDRKARLETAPAAGRPAGASVGAATMAPYLREPYLEFERRVRAAAEPGALVLDVGAGTGIHSFAAGEGHRILAVDISLESLEQVRHRARAHDVGVELLCADAECLPIANASVGVATTAGVLYCVDLIAFLRELRRVLRPGGTWIFVDSFDHNPIYRVNRFFGYLRGTRTRRALTNIPSERSLARIRQEFARVSVSYHGVFCFMGPVLGRILGGDRAARCLDALDRAAPILRRFAFKVVVTASEPRRHA